MLLPEAGLDALIEQLGILPRGDRKAVLARLSPKERARLDARIRGSSTRAPTSPFSADIALRVADANGAGTDGSMTAAGRAVLARVLAARQTSQREAAAPISLFDAVSRRLFSERSRA